MRIAQNLLAAQVVVLVLASATFVSRLYTLLDSVLIRNQLVELQQRRQQESDQKHQGVCLH